MTNRYVGIVGITWRKAAERKSGGCTGRPNELASFPGHPGATFLCGKPWGSTKKEKEAKKKPRGLWKLTPLMEIRRERGFPPRLEKASQTTLGFFTVPTSPTTAAIHPNKGDCLSEEWGAPPRRTAD